MKYLILIVFTILLFVVPDVKAEDGKDIFESLHCGICHKVDRGKTNPSLQEITQAYSGNENQLVIYLQGETDPIVKPEKGGTMKRYIEKTKSLSESERKALADFILSHSE